jgi:hypothetical protein
MQFLMERVDQLGFGIDQLGFGIDVALLGWIAARTKSDVELVVVVAVGVCRRRDGQVHWLL